MIRNQGFIFFIFRISNLELIFLIFELRVTNLRVEKENFNHPVCNVNPFGSSTIQLRVSNSKEYFPKKLTVSNSIWHVILRYSIL